MLTYLEATSETNVDVSPGPFSQSQETFLHNITQGRVVGLRGWEVGGAGGGGRSRGGGGGGDGGGGVERGWVSAPWTYLLWWILCVTGSL